MGNKNWRLAHWLLSQQAGVDLRRLSKVPAGAWRYVRDLIRFRRLANDPLSLLPCLHDWWGHAGTTSSEYFWQDLFVARLIFAAAPARHIDIGSRLDGFVAHVAAFRAIEVFDIRPLPFEIPGVTFRQVDVMNTAQVPANCADSVSCLHALEHFGLGRYGDPLEPRGVERGLASLARILQPAGTLYLSFPAGEDRVYFNAHRTASPATIAALASAHGLDIERVWLYNSRTHSFEVIELGTPSSISPEAAFTLGLYRFIRR
jgi:SAM-dependent methyltransferase